MNTNTSTKHANQKTRLIRLLAKGQEFSVAEIANRCRIANPSAVVAQLREDGARIYTNERKDAKTGRTVYKYRLAANS